MRNLGNKYHVLEGFRHHDWCFLPDDHPHSRLQRDVAPIWCGTPEDLLRGYSRERRLRLRFWLRAGRRYSYVAPRMGARLVSKSARDTTTNGHAPDDLAVWDDLAEQTTRAMPVSIYSDNQENRQDG